MTLQLVSSLNDFSTPVFDRPATSSLRALTRFMSTRTLPFIVKPYSAPLRATWAAYALAMSVFVGIQPVFTQVPPNLWRSIMATVMPAAANRAAKAGPAWPVPMMIVSKCRDTRHLLQGRSQATLGHCAGAVLAGRATADEDHVVVAYVGSSVPACSATM